MQCGLVGLMVNVLPTVALEYERVRVRVSQMEKTGVECAQRTAVPEKNHAWTLPVKVVYNKQY